ncbi:MAG: thiamine diphosphokinase [Aestuariibaculum sp.]
MNAKKVFLLLKGEPPKVVPNLSDYNLICATDGAYGFLKSKNIKPHLICGDFDSTDIFPENVEIIATPDQEFTDFDKALQLLFNRGYKTIHVYGASGKEQDHFLGNLSVALKWKNRLDLTFFDNYGRYFLLNENTQLTNCLHKIVSLVPFPEAHGIITQGLQYPLNKETLTLGSRIGTRNKAIKNEVSITFTEGELFVFVND